MEVDAVGGGGSRAGGSEGASPRAMAAARATHDVARVDAVFTHKCPLECHSLDRDGFVKRRVACLALPKPQRDLVLLGALSSCGGAPRAPSAATAPTDGGHAGRPRAGIGVDPSGASDSGAGRAPTTPTAAVTVRRRRSRYTYRVDGRHVCRATFCTAFGVTVTVLRALQAHLASHGVVGRVHARRGVRSTARTALSKADVDRVASFIRGLAVEHGTALPAKKLRLSAPGTGAAGGPGPGPEPEGQTARMALPRRYSLARLHREYQAVAQQRGWRGVGATKFTEILGRGCPDVVLLSAMPNGAAPGASALGRHRLQSRVGAGGRVAKRRRLPYEAVVDAAADDAGKGFPAPPQAHVGVTVDNAGTSQHPALPSVPPLPPIHQAGQDAEAACGSMVAVGDHHVLASHVPTGGMVAPAAWEPGGGLVTPGSPGGPVPASFDHYFGAPSATSATAATAATAETAETAATAAAEAGEATAAMTETAATAATAAAAGAATAAAMIDGSGRALAGSSSSGAESLPVPADAAFVVQPSRLPGHVADADVASGAPRLDADAGSPHAAGGGGDEPAGGHDATSGSPVTPAAAGSEHLDAPQRPVRDPPDATGSTLVPALRPVQREVASGHGILMPRTASSWQPGAVIAERSASASDLAQLQQQQQVPVTSMIGASTNPSDSPPSATGGMAAVMAGATHTAAGSAGPCSGGPATSIDNDAASS